MVLQLANMILADLSPAIPEDAAGGVYLATSLHLRNRTFALCTRAISLGRRHLHRSNHQHHAFYFIGSGMRQRWLELRRISGELVGLQSNGYSEWQHTTGPHSKHGRQPGEVLDR